MARRRSKRRRSSSPAAARVGWWLAGAVLLGLVGVLAVSTWNRHRPVPADRLTVADKSVFCVSVFNGNGRRGEARDVASRLRASDFRVEETDNATRFDYPRTLVIDRAGRADWAKAVAHALGDVPTVLERADTDCGIHVILGHDWSPDQTWYEE